MDWKVVFSKYGINLNQEKIEMFEKYFNMLVEDNCKFNLTNIIEYDDVWLKHFLDSCLPEKLFKENSLLFDIGGGAGFPSIPLKIIRPDLKITIIDSVNKKVVFMNKVIEKLGLKDIVAIHGRCEDMAKKIGFRENFDYCISRAVAPLSTLLEYSVPIIKLNGKLVLYKGSNYKSETDNTINSCTLLDCRLEDVKEINVAELDLTRYFLIYSKNKSTNNVYPRMGNKPRLQPLN